MTPAQWSLHSENAAGKYSVLRLYNEEDRLWSQCLLILVIPFSKSVDCLHMQRKENLAKCLEESSASTIAHIRMLSKTTS